MRVRNGNAPRGISKRDLLRYAGTLGGAGILAGTGVLTGRAQAPVEGTFSAENRIMRVTPHAVVVPCRIEVGDYRRDIKMGGTVVEVETADGLVGHGFTAITDSEIVAAAITRVAAPEIMGLDALSPEAVADRLHWRLTPRGQTGHAGHAIAAIDIALWDIAGKRLGQPVWHLMGGARREVPTYTTFGMAYMSPDELAAAARHLAENGRRRLKMVVAAGAAERLRNGEAIEDILAESAARVEAVRDAAGPEVELYIDANQGLDEYHTLRLIKRLADYDVGFFEEPLRDNDVRRMADLRRQSPIPIAAGQNETHIRRYRDFLVENAVDILQLNVCIGGGYTAGRKIAALGQAFGVPIENGGGYAKFNMHLHGGVANGGMVEWHLAAVAMGRVLYENPPDLTGDTLVMPQTPGVGFALNRDALEEYSISTG